jgi:hypothetical protein
LSWFSNTGLNTDHLEQVYILDRERFELGFPNKSTLKLSSNTSKFKELYAERVKLKPILVLLLQQSTLKQLTLRDIYLNQSVLHAIDLSGHNLQKLVLSDCDCMKFYNLNTDHLEHLEISYGLLDFTLVSNASSLTELCLSGTEFQYSKQENNVVHTLHQLRSLILSGINIDDNAITVTPEMKSITYIKHRVTSMTLSTWCTFVESLLSLCQSVEVDAGGITKEKLDFVRNDVRFEVIREETNHCIFQFKSRK